MLKTVRVSSNKKTGPIAVTYRSGEADIFGTCPQSCGLLPCGKQGASEMDAEYLRAVVDAVPRNGVAWTYSHFSADQLPMPAPGKTVINASCDTMAAAVAAVEIGRPAVVVVPAGPEWAGGVVSRSRIWYYQGVQFVRCPAELADNFTCQQCGGGRPLCARPERDYVVVFVAHGTSKKRVGTGTGGCYGSSGPVAIQWHAAKDKGAPDDVKAVLDFARSLPSGSMLRHHVVGDMGRAAA
jgi:hypothetical protein